MTSMVGFAVLTSAGLAAFLLHKGYSLWKKSRSDSRRLRNLNEKLSNDLADRRAIERELAHMASFSEMAPNPILETDTTGALHYVNPAAAIAFPDIQLTWSTHPVFEGIGEILDSLKREGKSMASRPIKVGERIFDELITLLDGGPGIRLYFNDVTELKRLDRLKTDFVNMVSHELRSPLTSINASIRLVTANILGATTTDQQEALHLALKNIDRLGRLINELLDISKIEAGKLELHCESADLKALAAEVAKDFVPLARERGLELDCQLPPDPVELFIDRDKIVQVFTNLVQNALKFVTRGRIQISIVPQATGVRCQVTDTGPGISAANLPKVFGKFQQFGQAVSGKEKGTGLGLSLCKGFVELHGGRIWVESTLGAGSTFGFDLPRLSPEGIFKEQVERFLQEAAGHGHPLTLIDFSVEQWTLTMGGDDQKERDVVLHRLEAIVKSSLGLESVVVSQRQRSVWLALPEIAKAAAEELASRVQREFETKLRVKFVSYPEDGTLSEQLLNRLSSL